MASILKKITVPIGQSTSVALSIYSTDLAANVFSVTGVGTLTTSNANVNGTLSASQVSTSGLYVSGTAQMGLLFPPSGGTLQVLSDIGGERVNFQVPVEFIASTDYSTYVTSLSVSPNYAFTQTSGDEIVATWIKPSWALQGTDPVGTYDLRITHTENWSAAGSAYLFYCDDIDLGEIFSIQRNGYVYASGSIASAGSISAVSMSATSITASSISDAISTQKVLVSYGKTAAGTAVTSGNSATAQKEINFVAGSNMTVTVNNNTAANRVDVTLASTGGGGGSWVGTATSDLNMSAYNVLNVGYLTMSSTGPRLKNSSGAFHLRNNGDTAYAALSSSNLTMYTSGGSVLADFQTGSGSSLYLSLPNGGAIDASSFQFTGIVYGSAFSASTVTSSRSSIGAVSTDGIVLENTTGANSGVPSQWSPRLRFRGTAYKTDATTGSQNHDWWVELVPTSTSGATTSQLRFAGQFNGGTVFYPLRLYNNYIMAPSILATNQQTITWNNSAGGYYFTLEDADYGTMMEVGEGSINMYGGVYVSGVVAANAFVGNVGNYGTISATSTTVHPGAYNTIDVLFANNVTLSLANGANDGIRSVIRVKQDATGGRTLTWGGTNIVFGADITSTVLSTTGGKTDVITVMWNSSTSKWWIVGFLKGF